MPSDEKTPFWQDVLYDRLRHHGIDLITYVPDGGHATTINRAIADPEVTAIALTNEAEGVPLLAGYHLGGRKGVMLMQSSGVGNCTNQLSLVQSGRFPFLSLITMRGDYGEQNEWQFPMGQAVEATLSAMGVRTLAVNRRADIETAVDAAVGMAFRAKQGVGVMLSQRVVGWKSF